MSETIELRHPSPRQVAVSLRQQMAAIPGLSAEALAAVERRLARRMLALHPRQYERLVADLRGPPVLASPVRAAALRGWR